MAEQKDKAKTVWFVVNRKWPNNRVINDAVDIHDNKDQATEAMNKTQFPPCQCDSVMTCACLVRDIQEVEIGKMSATQREKFNTFVKPGRDFLEKFLANWSTFDDIQKAYVFQESIKEIGEEKAKSLLMLLVNKDEDEYKRLKNMKFNVSIQFPLPEPSPEFETAPSANPGTLTLTLPLDGKKA